MEIAAVARDDQIDDDDRVSAFPCGHMVKQVTGLGFRFLTCGSFRDSSAQDLGRHGSVLTGEDARDIALLVWSSTLSVM